MTHTPLFPFDNSYIHLPDYFYSKAMPQPVKRPGLIRLNDALAEELGLAVNALDGDVGASVFAGNQLPDGAEPLAMVYTGHQFGHFNPQLGDGRAIMLGEIVSSVGERFDVQLKGSGRTPYSRGGDGRAALGPVLREYLLCEFMHRVGIPTTRALAIVTTGEQVVRERLLPGAIITRLSRSYVRVGTFQFFAARGNHQAVRELADYVIARNYPELKNTDQPYQALLTAVIERQARLIAQWMQLGFIHGVMNTDNVSVAGETIDYGPCAFMDDYHPERVYSSIDQQGRYAYNNQPAIAHWNLCRFAETLIPLLDDDVEAGGTAAQGIINTFPVLYKAYWLAGMRHKLGLTEQCDADNSDEALVDELLAAMAKGKADFTLTFYALSAVGQKASADDDTFYRLFSGASEAATTWLNNWRARLRAENAPEAERQLAMQATNPLYIPRNHLIEAAIRAAEDHANFTPFHQLADVLQNPYQHQQVDERYTLPPTPEQVVPRTFCGT